MRTTAILNLKGGVGKTTTVIHMARLLRERHGSRVLVVDNDPQCNLSQFFGAAPEDGKCADVLQTGWLDGVSINLIRPTAVEGVDILAADGRLMALDLSQLKTQVVKAYCFRMMVLELARLDKYDYVLFDCPPSFNAACAAALMAADDVVIPIKLDAFSIDGMTNIMQQVQNMVKINSKLRVAGVLPTMWYRDDTIRQAEAILRKSNFYVFPHIRYSKRMDTLTFRRELGSRHTALIQDYAEFVAAYARQGGGRNG